MYKVKRYYIIIFFILLCNLFFINLSFTLPIEYIKNGIVKIESEESIGTGFIIKYTNDTVFILTASHVVGTDPNPKIKFYKQKINKEYYAEVVKLDPDNPIRARELALLKIQRDDIPDNITSLKLNEHFDSSLGSDVMTIGFPIIGVPWGISKGEIMGQMGKDLIVSITVDEGNSGGPLLKNGRVVGIITECGTVGTGYAVPSKIIKITLDGWNFNISDDYDEGSYWQLVVSDIDFLPQFYEGLFAGNPDYRLSVDIDNGNSFIIAVNTRKKYSSVPFMIKDIESFQFKIFETDGIFGKDDFTSTIEVEKDELFIKNEYKLFFLNKIIKEYKEEMKNRRSLKLSLLLQIFNPEANSTADQSISSPLVLDSKRLYYDSINFNNSDATDYFKISSGNDSMISIIWIVSNFNNSFKVVKNKESINMSNIFENIDKDKKREDVYIIENNKNDLIICFQANNAFESADYLICNFSNENKISNFVFFIDELIRSESNKSGRTIFTNYAVVIKRLRNNLNIPCENLLPIIKKYLRRGTNDQQDILIHIIEEDLEDYDKANKSSTSSSINLENLIKLNKAEIGEIKNSEELYSLLDTKNRSLLIRTIKVIGDIGDKEGDIKILRPFLGSDNYNIRETTKQAIESITLNML